ncbi:MAG: hypothetical protein MK135_11440 [Polyangiaceae bacterium]|nr:hypothetical protein [Polyangiaceae bacterium]
MTDESMSQLSMHSKTQQSQPLSLPQKLFIVWCPLSFFMANTWAFRHDNAQRVSFWVILTIGAACALLPSLFFSFPPGA